MPRLIHAVPRYRLHRASGQAVVTLEGQDFYLGPWKSRASRVEYDRLIGEFLAAGRKLPAPYQSDSALTVTEIISRYWNHAKTYYGDTGKRRGTANNLKPTLRLLRQTYGHTRADQFGPLALKVVLRKLVESDRSRKGVNMQLGRIKAIFKWAASEELISTTVYESLRTVEGLRKGRTTARESTPVKPVSDMDVEATLPYLGPIVADMVRLQRLTGARPGEICIMRPADVERSGKVWHYRPHHHKTQHLDQDRVISIGPRAQEILAPYLLRGAESYCFSPIESERHRRAERHAQRKTPLSCGNRPKPNGKTKQGPCYTNDSYRRAIHRAIDKLNADRTKQSQDMIPRWSPNQLRHAAATELRAKYGLDAAQVVLGHTQAHTTQIYAEANRRRADEAIAAIG